jgi:hypothetical protein
MRRTGLAGQVSGAWAAAGSIAEMTTAANSSTIAFIKASYLHTQSIRLASGQEALVTRAVARDGRAGYGFSLQLDATQARHMALYQLGLKPERPKVAVVLAHPWETAWESNQPVPWDVEPAFSQIKWLP